MVKNEFKDLSLPKNTLDGIYRGVIENNKDPLKAGRCKIRVFGIHSLNKIATATDGIPTDDLPWAQPALSLIEGSISKYGFFGVPLQGSHVFLFFENGNILQPRYFATVPAIPTEKPNSNKGFSDPDGIYPEVLNVPDWDTRNGEYPHNVVLSVHSGHYFEFDSTPDNERIKIFHRTGTYVEIDKDGNIFLNGVKNQTDTITDNRTATIGGKWTVNITGETNINCTGSITIESSNSITLKAPTITLDGDVTGTSTIIDTTGNTPNHTH